MKCEIMEEMLSAYVDGELSPEEQKAVERHVAACPDCMALLDEFKEISSMVHSEFLLISAPLDLVANVQNQINLSVEKRQSTRMRTSGLIGVALLLGAMAAILLSPVGIAFLSITRVFVRVTSNLLPLLWHQIGSQGLLTAGVVGVGVVITVVSMVAMKKMMQAFVPGQ